MRYYKGNFRPGKVGPGQRKRGIPTCLCETFYMQSRDIIYEEFITMLGSRQNGTEFYPGLLRSCNHHFSRMITQFSAFPW